MTIFHVIKYSGMSDEELRDSLPIELKEKWLSFIQELAIDHLCWKHYISTKDAYFEYLRKFHKSNSVIDVNYVSECEKNYLPRLTHYIRYSFTAIELNDRIYFAQYSLNRFSLQYYKEYEKCRQHLKQLLLEYEE